MSFLVSFNGQFSPYVHSQIEIWREKVTPVFNLEALTTDEVDHKIPDSEVVYHPPSREVSAYEKQIKTFEKTKKKNYARDIMSHPAHSVQKITQASEAITLMGKFGFRHLPVLDGPDKLVGILSDRELFGAGPSSTCEEVMVQKVIVALQTARIQEIAHIMLQEKINSLPILDENHHMVGIITQSDILRYVIGSEEFSGFG